MHFTIDRSKWRCGGMVREMGPVDFSYNTHARGEGAIRLLNDSGHMCCLGQVSQQCGVPNGYLTDIGEPNCVAETTPEFASILLNDDGSCNSQLATDAMNTNDSAALSDEEREQRLVDIFAKEGHSLAFTGEYHIPQELQERMKHAQEAATQTVQTDIHH